MSSQKDASQLNSGSGLAGRRSVGASSVTFAIPNGPTATLWLETLNADTANIGTIAVDTLTSDTISATTVNGDIVNGDTVNGDTVNADTVSADTVNADTVSAQAVFADEGDFTVSLSTESFTANTGIFRTLLTTDLIESVEPTLTLNTDVDVTSNLGVTGDISGNKITANDTVEGLRAYVISAADGDNAGDIRVRANLTLEDSAGPLPRDLTLGKVIASGTVTSETEVSLYDPVGDSSYRPLSGMLQRFSEISEAFEATNVGEACVVETYDPTRPLGHLEWTSDALGDVEAIATDGRYLYSLGSNGVAVATAPNATTAVTYNLSNWSPGLTDIHITTNGQFVAFCYGVYADIFDVGDGGGPLITFSAPNPNPVQGAWMGHDALYITQAELGTPLLWKIYLDGVTPEQSLGISSVGPISGYGNYLLVSLASGGNGLILVDLTTFSTVGSFLDIGTIPRIALDENYMYLGDSGVQIYSLDKENGVADANLLWEHDEGNTDSFFAYDHRYLYILDSSYQVFVYRKDTLQKVAILDVTTYLSDPDVIKGITVDGQYLYIALTDLSGPSDQDIAKINMAHAPSTFVKVDPDVGGERIWNHVMVPVENHLPQLREVVRADAGIFNILRSPVTPLALGSFQYDSGSQTFAPYADSSDQINILESGRNGVGVFDFAVSGPPSLGAVVSVNLNTGGTPLIVETEIDYLGFAKVRVRFYNLSGNLADPADDTILRIAVFSPGSYSAWAGAGI